ncbi:UDP-N-acetylglucosamine 1-carboxyvinyltransferase [bacterium]|nr:UDP-N-acetylglucosamine 1-carboxyvinyltransferase [bacterium]
MDKFMIWGGERLHGEVEISACKNAVLPVLAAALLAETPSVIKKAPWLKDVDTMLLILQALGVTTKRSFEGDVTIDPTTLKSWEAPYELIRKMRSSIYVLGALLGKLGKAVVSLPGGCVIGPRPIDLHIKGLTQLGAAIEKRHGYLIAEAKQLRGARIFLGGPFGSSVGATIDIMLAAVKAEGVTVIESAACEPDVADVALFLNKMGAKITGAGTPTLTIEGTKELHGTEHTVIPDRIEAGTYMIAAAATDGDIALLGAEPRHLEAVIAKLREAGVEVFEEEGKIRVRSTGTKRPTDVTTLSYPGFPTDLQAQFMALMSITSGVSRIVEKIYPDRFMHVGELGRLGADMTMDSNSALVRGVPSLSGAPVMASDLRASAALIIAGLVAEGETLIHRVYHIDRGYVDIENKLANLGAKIRRVKAN